jgi:GTP-binding protein
MFVDQVRVRLRAGNGGAGVVSFQKQGRHPRGRPVGGSGGSGGAVIVTADAAVATLLRYKRNPHHSAGDGKHGQGDFRHGKHGEDLILLVPPGTSVFDDEGTLLADLVEPGQSAEVLAGGRGGRGNAGFVSRQHRHPSFAEQGEYGDSEWFTLELKLVADAALIGYPNAGKSTLISRVSAAKPKIADYPFTTLEPNLGVVSHAEREFVLADIPGLIEGASDGKGLGHEFLRHTERARALVVLLDPSDLQTESIVTQYDVLLSELDAHSPQLMDRPKVVAVSKADLGSADLLELSDRVEGELLVFSAITGEGLDELLHAIADAVDTAKRDAPEREGFVLHRPVDIPFTIHRVKGKWLVEGRAAERAVSLNDLTLPEAAAFAASRLARIGVDDALRQAGAVPGDDVQIGELVFEFQNPEADDFEFDDESPDSDDD